MKQPDRLGILVHLPSTHNYIACMLGPPIPHNLCEVKKKDVRLAIFDITNFTMCSVRHFSSKSCGNYPQVQENIRFKSTRATQQLLPHQRPGLCRIRPFSERRNFRLEGTSRSVYNYSASHILCRDSLYPVDQTIV